MRFTIPDLLVDQQRIEQGLKRQFAEIDALIAEVEQPADPFDGMGDFEVHPLAFELMQERTASRLLMVQVAAADAALAVARDSQAREANLIALFDRPLSKLNKKELTGMIRIAQDILVQPVEVLS